MKRPTEDQIAEFETLALSKSNLSGDVVELGVEEAGVTVFVRPLSLAEYREYCDGAFKEDTRVNSRVQAMFRATMFPKRSQLNEAYQNFPGLPKRVCDEAIEMLAGKPEREAPEEWFAVDYAEGLDDLLEECGIARDAFSKLRVQYPHRGQLWICKIASLGCAFVVKRPSVEAWNKFARDVGEGFFQASLDLAADCCVYPENAAADLKRYPALAPLVFFMKLKDLAAGSSKSVAKKFVRSASRSVASK